MKASVLGYGRVRLQAFSLWSCTTAGYFSARVITFRVELIFATASWRRVNKECRDTWLPVTKKTNRSGIVSARDGKRKREDRKKM
jgi:hypothetical protein